MPGRMMDASPLKSASGSRVFGALLVALVALAQTGCPVCGDFVITFIVSGKVVDSRTGDPIGGASVSVGLLKDGELIHYTLDNAYGPSVSNTLLPPRTASDGSFALTMTQGERFGTPACTAPAPGTLVPVVPDRMVVGIVPAGCPGQNVFLDINEETVVDLSFPGDVIELKEPIAISPCEN